ncbi:NAD(P)H-dependent oxidoreductase [Saccharicrinis fermentans]|uniref:Glutathione-regulated potassium-efflux system ancillary protein KefF n=1 Tax=Saccharicrinis fermentans DSM 9555 = JCM 21142 TaxID=869213 RepID=W7Y6F2_9BACT|nr:NAD(P)H-dependent oxidoreductase [Saccharicrinis fermentans]GAF03203.1 glutathione-regulated potassium-efflux system ancillary protein KefF [Saccharicrinis fermentans DSM 9555 = JCM 21142]
MTHLIIYAHPSEDSFSRQLVDRIKQCSEPLNTVIVRDLYAMDFNAVLKKEELNNLKKGIIAEDVDKEQAFVEDADLISVVYPLWWASFPAILKGYIDRVFSYGFAYRSGKNGMEGLLTGRAVVMHTSMGNSVSEDDQDNLLPNLTAIHGHEVFGFCDMDLMQHFFYPEIISATELEKEAFIENTVAYYKELFISERN